MQRDLRGGLAARAHPCVNWPGVSTQRVSGQLGAPAIAGISFMILNGCAKARAAWSQLPVLRGRHGR
jgi:hypothetical protein